MLKRITLLITISMNLNTAGQEQFNQFNFQTNPIQQILDNVKKDKYKIDGAAEVEFRNLEDLSKHAQELLIHTKEIKKSLKMGTDVLNGVDKYLSSMQGISSSDLKKAQSAIRAAQQEHSKAIKVVENTKNIMEKNYKQIETQVERLNQSLKSLNTKSKSAIDKSQSILQTLRAKQTSFLD